MLLEELFGIDVSGYDAPLELAKRWRLSEDRVKLERAMTLLTELSARFPLAVDIVQELILVQMDLCPDQVEVTLSRAEDVFNEAPSEELLCRFGRWYKEQGDRHRQREEYARAEKAYRRSADRYATAYAIRKGHYPGINLATIWLLLAALARLSNRQTEEEQFRRRSRTVANELLAIRPSWPNDQLSDLDVWHPASEAEALLLLGDWPRAAALYRAISARGWEYNTMKKQVQRILDAWRMLGEKDIGPFYDLKEVFPPIPD